jgi:hypothetical protein
MPMMIWWLALLALVVEAVQIRFEAGALRLSQASGVPFGVA